MELGLKEKKILSVFSVVLVLFVYIFWILLPQIEVKQSLDTEITKLKSDVATNLVYKKSADSSEKEMKIIKSKINRLRKIYPPMMNYDDLIICIKNLAVDSGVIMSDVQFGNYNVFGAKKGENTNSDYDDAIKTITDKSVVKIARELGFMGEKEAKMINTEKDIVLNGMPYTFSAEFTIKGNNAQIKSFLTEMYDLNNEVATKEFSLIVSDLGEQNAAIKLEFLGIMDKYAGEYSLLEDGTFILAAPAGKSDFSAPYQGYSSGNNETQAATNNGGKKRRETDDYNFILNVLPYGKGLTAPTIELSSQGIDDSELGVPFKRFINADNPKVENIEIYLEERNGGYYCKYKTQSEAFPDQNYEKLVKINPINDRFGLFVVSSKRASKDDISGVDVNIVNKTKKEVLVKVKYDDIGSPRVKVNRIEGSLKFE